MRVVERLAALVERAQRERSDAGRDAPFDDSAASRRLVDVLLKELLRQDVGEVLEPHPCTCVATKQLGGSAGELEAGVGRQRTVGELCLLPRESIEADVPVRLRAGNVAVFTA